MSNLPLLLLNDKALKVRELETLAVTAIEHGEYNTALAYLKRMIKERKSYAPQTEVD
jgi:hypothetical protein